MDGAAACQSRSERRRHACLPDAARLAIEYSYTPQNHLVSLQLLVLLSTRFSMSCTSHVNTPGTVAFLPLANPGTILHGPSTPSPAVPLASRPLHILDSSGSLADELEELHVLHDRHVLCNQSGRQTQAPLGPVAHLDPEFQQECQAFASVPWSEPPAEAFNPDVDGPLLVRVTPGISQV